jgi:hypothetical protein
VVGLGKDNALVGPAERHEFAEERCGSFPRI